jgi:hypothetical protein
MEAIDKTLAEETKALNVGETFEFMGENKTISEVYEDGINFELKFSDGTSGLVFGEKDKNGILQVKEFTTFADMKLSLTGVEGKDINTLMKGTLLKQVDTIYDAGIFSGYSKSQIKNYISTLGEDTELFDAISTLI